MRRGDGRQELAACRRWRDGGAASVGTFILDASYLCSAALQIDEARAGVGPGPRHMDAGRCEPLAQCAQRGARRQVPRIGALVGFVRGPVDDDEPAHVGSRGGGVLQVEAAVADAVRVRVLLVDS